MKTFQDFLHLMDFIGNQTVQGPNESLFQQNRLNGLENGKTQLFKSIPLRLCSLCINLQPSLYYDCSIFSTFHTAN